MTSQTSTRISAVVPVYAETESLIAVVHGLHERLATFLFEVLIVVTPVAPAPTRDACDELVGRYATVRVLRQRRFPGLGWAVREGIAAARGSHILMIDADGEMDVSTAPLLLEALCCSGADMAVASRWMPGGGAEGYPRLKYVLNRGFQGVVRRLYRTHVHDVTLGFKLGRADLLQAKAWRATYHEVACETTLRMIRDGHRVVEVPTTWRRRTAGTSSNPLRRNVRYLALALALLIERRPATQ